MGNLLSFPLLCAGGAGSVRVGRGCRDYRGGDGPGVSPMAAKSPRGGPHALNCRDWGAQSCRVCSGWHLGTWAPNVPAGQGRTVWTKTLQHRVGTEHNMPTTAGAMGGCWGAPAVPVPISIPPPAHQVHETRGHQLIPGGTTDIRVRGQPEQCHRHPRTTALFLNPKTALFLSPKPRKKGLGAPAHPALQPRSITPKPAVIPALKQLQKAIISAHFN